ncbi:MAG: hypothetical protein LBE04_00250, partial [Prevotellaceae bacterium]|nr:hypothetical protein [Prevotellaceae bacterium]
MKAFDFGERTRLVIASVALIIFAALGGVYYWSLGPFFIFSENGIIVTDYILNYVYWLGSPFLLAIIGVLLFPFELSSGLYAWRARKKTLWIIFVYAVFTVLLNIWETVRDGIYNFHPVNIANLLLSFAVLFFAIALSLAGKKTLRTAFLALIITASAVIVTNAVTNIVWRNILFYLPVLIYPVSLILLANAFVPRKTKEARQASDNCMQTNDTAVYRQTVDTPAQTNETVEDETAIIEEGPKASAIFWIIIQFLISIGLIIGGLSGEFVLRSSDSSGLLVLFGFLWLAYDLYSLYMYLQTKARFKAVAKEVRKNRAYKIDNPCTVSLRRQSSIVGIAVDIDVFLNGVRQEMLRNGKTVEMQTSYAKNILVVKSVDSKTNILKFEATPGGHIKIIFKYLGTKLIIEEGQTSVNDYQAQRVESQRPQRPQQPQQS